MSARITDGAALSNVLGQGVTVGTGGPGPLAAIAISPQPSTIDAGGSQGYTAEGFDSSDVSRGDVTGDTTFSISPNGGTTGASCTGATCTATQAGDYTVTGDDGGFTDTATLHVVPAGLASITISPDTASISAGGSQPYTAEGFDSYGNSRGDVTGATTFTITPNGGTTGASCTLASCTATQAGGYTVTGTDGAFSDTAALTVTAGTLASITISPDTASISAGGSQPYTAEGFDSYGNSRGDVTGATTFTIAPNGGTTGASCTVASCTATQAGGYTVTGTDGAFSDTAALTVTAGTLASITISPDTASIAAGGSQPYTAEGFDSFHNSLGNVTGATTFTIAPNGGTTGASCAVASCTATQAGGYTVTGTDGAFSDTAALTVTAGTLASITISPDTASIAAGGSQPYTAEGFDSFHNSLGNVTGSTTFTITPNGGATGASCTLASCTATQAGGYTVTGTDGAFSDTAALTVTAGTLASITISPHAATIASGGSRSYTAEAFDAFHNSLGSVTGSTTFTIAPNGGTTGASCTVATCTAVRAGSYTVTGTDGAFSDTATLTVPISAFNSSATVNANSIANPVALDYAPASATVQSVTQGTNGTVAIDGTGHGVTYTPALDFVGTDTFTYTVTDGAGHTATATVTVAVQTSGSLADAMVLEDGTFHPLNGFDIHFAKSKLGTSYVSAENTDPGEMHLNVDLVNHTGVDINTSKGNRVVAVFTVPDMPTGCGLTAVDCAVTAGDLGRPAFKLDDVHEIKVHPDDKTDLMPVSLLFKSTGACGDPGGYTPTFPVSRAPKCIKISGFAIPRSHKAKVDIEFRFRTGSNWPAASNPQQNFVAGFNFGLTKLLTYGFGTPSAVTYSNSDNLVTVGTGKSATAVGGFLFDTSGNPVGAPYHVRLWKQSAGASCSAGSPVADVTPNGDGFYYASLADGTAYFVQVCKGGMQVATHTLAKKLDKNKLDEEDFSGLPPSP